MDIISLVNNSLAGTISVDILHSFLNLDVVNFSGNKLEGTIPNNFNTQSQLQIVYLEDNLLEGPLPETICTQPSLEILSVFYNQLNGTIRQQIGALIGLLQVCN